MSSSWKVSYRRFKTPQNESEKDNNDIQKMIIYNMYKERKTTRKKYKKAVKVKHIKGMKIIILIRVQRVSFKWTNRGDFSRANLAFWACSGLIAFLLKRGAK